MKILIIIILLLLSVLITIYTYYGGFIKLQCNVESQGGETVVYKNITGDYRQTGVVMDEIYYSLLNKYKIETYKGYGKYLDNPKKVEKTKLRSEAGNIIEAKDPSKLSNLPEEFLIKEIPVKKYITTEFPYKGKLSVIFSIMKVYPALNKFTNLNGYSEDGAVIEIYDIPNKKILYRKEILEKI